MTRFYSFVFFLEKECKEIIKKRIASEAAVFFTSFDRGRLIALRDQLVRRRGRLQTRAATEAGDNVNLMPPPPNPNTQGNNDGGDQENWVDFDQLPIITDNDQQQNTEEEDEMDQVD